MTSEEKLWRRFKDIQNKINSLSSIVQNPLEGHQVPQEEIDEWREAGYKVYSELGLLILKTYTFLKDKDAKDI